MADNYNEQAQDISNRATSKTKEFLVDMTGLPYGITDTIMYLFTLVNVLNSFSNVETDPSDYQWNSWQFITAASAMFIFFITSLATFSITNAKFLDFKFNSPWTRTKTKIRTVTGIPTTIIKNFTGSGSFYLFCKMFMSKGAALGFAIPMFLFSTPSELAVLWSNLDKTDNQISSETIHRMGRREKYAFIHSFTFIYSFSNVSVYLWNSLNTKKLIEVGDEVITTENDPALFWIIVVAMLFPLIATYVSYSHLAENMFGLISHESPAYTKTKRTIKKWTGPLGSIIKIFNASTASYSFFKDVTNSKAESIIIVSVAALSGLLTQLSLLYGNPVKKEKDSEYSPLLTTKHAVA